MNLKQNKISNRYKFQFSKARGLRGREKEAFASLSALLLMPRVFEKLRELYCQLFDDNLFDNFLLDKSLGLKTKQRECGDYLQMIMKKYLEQQFERFEPQKVYNDPRWEEIRQSAKLFYSALCECE